ncbi:Rieske 2Fe-2S domain-containing protein [Kitasatospora sp. NBC_00240]|uniref:Rieske 2Fe-2S domain-containing protein n=1 Tax=Kitasatospora sp. NBC_00240 TaxID=2903567 RepID=UPI00225A4B8B|nr:Rieske 2Fe-2S domain-containing protein [Kitasatospora sp. NBC_00240]MCX5215245.1 Rieske 2Fe-2S domain-containing protein [Kitasatospora sp. NBC_00240]
MGTLIARIHDAAAADGIGSRLLKALDALGDAEDLDRIAEPLQRVVQGLPLGRLRGVLHGRPLGHPLHPALVQLPLGAWVSAAVLDVVPGSERAAEVLVAVGVVAAAPAAWTGWVDWAEQHEQQMRTGLLHAASMAVAVALHGASWVARSRDSHRLGRALGLAGLAAVSCGAALGGHLAYRQAAGANKAEPVAHLVEPGWHTLGRTADFPVGEAARRTIGEVAVLVVREAEEVFHVLADRCSHASGPLSQGKVADGCVTCPWHGSVFRLTDGWNVDGPATAPQPKFVTRTDDQGNLQARLPGAG